MHQFFFIQKVFSDMNLFNEMGYGMNNKQILGTIFLLIVFLMTYISLLFFIELQTKKSSNLIKHQ